MVTRDWFTLVISVIALLVSGASLYFSLRREKEARHVDYIRNVIRARHDISAMQYLLKKEVGRLEEFEELIKSYPAGEARESRLADIGEFIFRTKRIVESNKEMITFLSDRTIFNAAWSRKGRLGIEKV